MASPQNEAVVKQSDTVSSLSSSLPPPYSDHPNANVSYSAFWYDNPPSYNNTTILGRDPPYSAPPYQQNPAYGIPAATLPPAYAASVSVVQPFYGPQATTSQVIIVRSMQTGVVSRVLVDHPQHVSMVGAILLSCCVFWFCGFVFGGIAFILAMIGQSSALAGDTRGAIRLRNASYGLSAIGVVIIGIIIGLTVTLTPKNPYGYGFK